MTNLLGISKKNIVLKIRGAEFNICFCPIQLDILWNNLIGISQKAVATTAEYIEIGNAVKAKEMTKKEGKAAAAELEKSFEALNMEAHVNSVLDAVEVALIANNHSFDRKWWLNNVSLDEVMIFLSAIVEKDLKKKEQLAELLLYVQ